MVAMICIGGRTFTKEQLMKEVEEKTEIGIAYSKMDEDFQKWVSNNKLSEQDL